MNSTTDNTTPWGKDLNDHLDYVYRKAARHRSTVRPRAWIGLILALGTGGLTLSEGAPRAATPPGREPSPASASPAPGTTTAAAEDSGDVTTAAMALLGKVRESECLREGSQTSAPAEVKIKQPLAGARVASSLFLSGTSRLTAGQHLYTFLYREDYCNYSFLPGKEVSVDADGDWGELYQRDDEKSGQGRKVVAAVVDDRGHRLLQTVLTKKLYGASGSPWIQRLPADTRLDYVDFTFT